MRTQCCGILIAGQCSDCPLTAPVRPPTYIKQYIGIGEPPESPRPSISAARVRELYARNSLAGHFATRWMTYDQFLSALRETGVEVKE